MASHRYPDPDGTSDCAYGCGCWMGPFNSGGPQGIDPFGECPKAPPPAPKKPTPVQAERARIREELLPLAKAWRGNACALSDRRGAVLEALDFCADMLTAALDRIVPDSEGKEG